MIAFGSSITKPEVYESCAATGFRRAMEPDSAVYAFPSVGSIYRSYNALLDQAAETADLEALVLVHQDTEIVDQDFCQRVRAALSDERQIRQALETPARRAHRPAPIGNKLRRAGGTAARKV